MSLIRSLLVSRKIGLNNKVRHQTLFSFQKQQAHHFSWGNFKLNSSFQRLQNQPSSLHYSFMNPYFARKQYFFSLVSMMLLQTPFLSNYYTCYSQCESILLPSQDCSQASSSIIIQKTQVQTNYVNQMKRAIRVLKRILQLFLTFLPVTALYPIHNYISSSQQLSGNDSYISSDWYLRLCLRCVEWSGAAMIKLMQWASSRPDLFGSEFCSVFCRLQDQTTPHSLRHTHEVLKKAFGPAWEERIKLSHIIGSGCIGQVYKGEVLKAEGQMETVAIKVIHPNVRDNIDADLDILRALAYTLDHLPFSFSKTLKWLNLGGMAEEFASMLKIQLDLRTEAMHLNKFNKNFAKDPHVIFPKVVKEYKAHENVLIETFCEGIPVITYANENKENETKLTKLCHIGIKTVCKMIFEDNFVHSDLHPGNIFVSPCGEKLIVLDAGIVTEYADTDHELIVSILKSFIRKDGRRAGKLMIADSNQRRMKELKDSGAVDENGYIQKIKELTDRANGENFFMEHLGTYISYICEAAASHHVMMNQSFVSIALAVKVQEGVALSLDPGTKIHKIANPIILRADLNRRVGKHWVALRKELESLLSF